MGYLILASAPAAATVTVAPPPVVHVLVQCGQTGIDLTNLPPDVQMATLLAAQKLMSAQTFVALVQEKWPNLIDGAHKLLTLCGAV
jgi:hypothetical protein